MPDIYLTHPLPYNPHEMYDLVADIEAYPEFAPWCEGACIIEGAMSSGMVLAELTVGYKGILKPFTSRVFFDPKQRKISAELGQGPFKHLYVEWNFLSHSDGCQVEFDVSFEFRSKLLQLMMNSVSRSMSQTFLNAFIKRADEMYGP